MGITGLSDSISWRMLVFMIRILITLAIALVLSPCANSQGLKGAAMPEKILGRLEYIKGNNDQERWKTFQQVQPKIIGMTFEQVDSALTGEITHRAMNEVEYGLTQNSVKMGSTESCLHVRVFFRNGIAWKYEVKAVP